MSALEIVAIVAAGFGAGVANAIVGSGTLITFPTLIAFGYAPVLANVSNTTGLVFGNAASIAAWRRELEGQRTRAIRLGAASVAGGVTGALLLFELPASAFRAIVPVCIGTGVVLVLVQPLVTRQLARRRAAPAGDGHGWAAACGLFLAGVYGGYFGAGQGLLIIAVLGFAVADTLHRLTALRNVLAGATNTVAAVAFVVATHIAWGAVLLIAVGSTLGGWAGVHVGRRLPPFAYRLVIAAVGVVAVVRLTV
ncbi:MAG TPA: sulfite exporter TauE/SafE family protein [Gaiellaceae bacterium]|nr:sulfite exporter TauE/SafE family protein [Gaiellaceae bacterium]